VDEIIKEGKLSLDPEFCQDVIKAAPMHDLGKIAVDDVILRKPGRYTPDEYDIMKTHAAEGAHIVHRILEGTADREFAAIAENVAHYHHERWDGSGYPDGLKGEEIPIEARIMAIADVYDALVSKRVYKDSMSFEQADEIILGSMGTQFDPSLEPYYSAARPALEEYYSGTDR
jgi:putative two-component system response regulator